MASPLEVLARHLHQIIMRKLPENPDVFTRSLPLQYISVGGNIKLKENFNNFCLIK